MATEKEKLIKARSIMNSIIENRNPYTNEEITDASFLDDPRMIRCFSYIVSVLTDNIEGRYSTANRSPKRESFHLTEEQLSEIVQPDGDVGINDFCKAVNSVIDTTRRKGISGAKLNKRLKEMGILKDIVNESGRKRTAVTEDACKYGISTIKNVFNGVEYDKVVYSDEGKKFLMGILQDYVRKNDELENDEEI